MNKDDLIRAAAEKSGLTQTDIWKVVNVLPGIIQKAVAGGDKVQITGFGTFEKRFRQGRSVKDPCTGEPIRTSDKYVPAFKAGKGFREAVNAPKPKKTVRKKRK
ncbi:MAG: HU family DNA-binding protein [Acidaminococcaceae bacterium]|nr:HU family DNA-binding protein [Acidaminococcaceae bacterium]MBR2183106.1 HU family DNA-binding protein [Acidaminococcaceae bacterium]